MTSTSSILNRAYNQGKSTSRGSFSGNFCMTPNGPRKTYAGTIHQGSPNLTSESACHRLTYDRLLSNRWTLSGRLGYDPLLSYKWLRARYSVGIAAYSKCFFNRNGLNSMFNRNPSTRESATTSYINRSLTAKLSRCFRNGTK